MRTPFRLSVPLAALFALLAGAQPRKIVVMDLPPAEVAELQRANPGVNIVAPAAAHAGLVRVTADAPEQSPDRAALLREVADADAIIGSPGRELIQAAKRLQWVQILSAGVETYRYPELVDGNIVVTNGRGVASPGIADHAIGMLLALTRKLTWFAEARLKEDWDRRPYGLLELEGKTAVIVGVGNIGSQVARRANAFGMTVIGVDPKEMNPSPFVQRLVYPDRLDEVLPLADVVFVCAPLTPESTGMFGARQFDLMKKGARFIAVSRGGLYSTDALVGSLRSGKLAGAAVDVVTPEPLPKGHPLWKFPNVLITPHVATESDAEAPRRLALVKENIARFAKGERLRNVVDMRKGY